MLLIFVITVAKGRIRGFCIFPVTSFPREFEMSTGLAGGDSDRGNGSGISWGPVWAGVALFAIIAILLYAFKGEGRNFNWACIGALAFGTGLMVGGFLLIRAADSPHNTVDTANFVGVIVFSFGFVICAGVFVPQEGIKEYQRITSPYEKVQSPKPHLVFTAAPAKTPPLQWVEVKSVPSDAKNVYVQLKLTSAEAKQLAVPDSMKTGGGKIVGWFEDSKGVHSLTDDL